MNKLDEILKRLYLAMEFKKDLEFCEKYDIKANTLSTWKKRKKIPYELLEKISQSENLSLDWILTGRGQMKINSAHNLLIEKIKKKQKITNIDSSNDSIFEIDMLNVKAGAGEGIYNYEIEVIDKIVMDKAFFKTIPDPSKMKIIEVDGDSMYPTLQSGDFVIIDETKTNGIDGIYALQLHNQILIKRLQFNLDGTIEIKSDNQNYNTQKYNPKDTQVPLHIIGMKTLTIQR